MSSRTARKARVEARCFEERKAFSLDFSPTPSHAGAMRNTKRKRPSTGRKNGRPCKLDAAVVAKLVEAIELSSPYELAAMYAGISYMTLRRWIVKGERAKDGEWAKFCEDIKLAQGRGAIGCLRSIGAEAERWQARAWLLERRHPQHFSKVDRHEISGTKGAPPIRTKDETPGPRPAPEDPRVFLNRLASYGIHITQDTPDGAKPTNGNGSASGSNGNGSAH